MAGLYFPQTKLYVVVTVGDTENEPFAGFEPRPTVPPASRVQLLKVVSAPVLVHERVDDWPRPAVIGEGEAVKELIVGATAVVAAAETVTVTSRMA